jgi:hypothetical protein
MKFQSISANHCKEEWREKGVRLLTPAHNLSAEGMQEEKLGRPAIVSVVFGAFSCQTPTVTRHQEKQKLSLQHSDEISINLSEATVKRNDERRE